MDLSKQPGISFKSIILTKESFFREPNYPMDPNVVVNFAYSFYNVEESNDYYGELTTSVKSIHDNIEALALECTFIGKFAEIPGEKNMDIEDYVKNAAPALMLPYIREHIALITQKAGVKPILLAPINIMALLKNDDEKNEPQDL